MGDFKNKYRFQLICLSILSILLVGLVSAETSFGNTAHSSFSGVNSYQYVNPSFTNLYSGSDINTYWPQLAEDMANNRCYGNTDFLVMIPPAGCSPSVVRSDLLAEHNVPVFCQLESAKVNPLIKVSSIKSISFKGDYPSEIAGVSFYPSRAAVRSYTTLLGSPVVNNIGYVVIILKKQSNETASPKNISGTLTATMYYDAEKAFGVGSTEFYLEQMSDSQWETDKYLQSFWQGRGLLRLVDVQRDGATIQVLSQDGNVIRTETLKTGETGAFFYFPGFYCRAALRLKLNDIDSPEDSVILSVDGVQMEARKGTKLGNTGCRVTSLNVLAGDTGTVRVSCTGGAVDLSLLNMYNANLTVDKVEKNVGLASNVKENYYLAYAGVTPRALKGHLAGSSFVVLINGTVPDNKVYSDLVMRIDNTFSNLGSSEVDVDIFKSRIVPSKYTSKDLVVLFGGNSENGIRFDNLLTSDNKAVTDDVPQSSKELAAEYFASGDEVLQQLLNEYSSMTNTGGSNYGENGLYEEIELTRQLQQKGMDFGAKKVELMNKFIELYPNSGYTEGIRQELSIAQRTDATNAYKSVFSNNEYHTIGVVRFEPAELGDKSFELVVNNQNARSFAGSTSWHEGDNISLSRISGTANANDYLIVKSITAKGVTFEYHTTKISNGNVIDVVGSSPTLQFSDDPNQIIEPTKLGSSSAKDTYSIYLSDVQVEKTAYVSIISELKTSSEANFTFNIGVEQRAIELSPEKAQKEADELNKTIQDWEAKNEKLGKLVEGWKAVCLSTGLFMQVKNLVNGYSGQSIARQNVMNIYEGICKKEMATNPGKYSTIDACYSAHSEEINADVSSYTDAIKKINDKIENDYSNNLSEFQQESSCSYNINDKTIKASQINSWADARQCMLYAELSKVEGISQDLKDNLQIETDAQFATQIDEVNNAAIIAKLKDELPVVLRDSYDTSISSKSGTISIITSVPMSREDLNNAVKDTDSISSVLIGFSDSESIGVTTKHINGQWYLFISKDDGPLQSYKFETVSGDPIQNLEQTNLEVDSGKTNIDFNIVSPKKCENNYTAPTVIYYDSNPNKGLPAIVPVDSKSGWYAFVPQDSSSSVITNTLSSSGNQVINSITGNAIQGYTSSGEVVYFWLCNVGANGRMEQRGGDDFCQSFNTNNANYEAFSGCGLNTNNVKNLVQKAIANIRSAASQYRNGVTRITLSNVGEVQVEPSSVMQTTGYQCQDFMSPEDCKLLYNVCDPVICPPSRCNFGGKLPVANVIQSGIIGSAVLCLKNFVGFGGDVYIPVCLTGIHAGIEGYISILKAQQSCLQDYATSGKHVGICDEITAVYKCEFFWRQVSPLMQNLVPSLAELVYTGRWNKQASGGEYATFQASWDNMQKSIDYFKNTYASTSFTAFKFGNVEEIGSTYCRNFLGTSIPTSADAIDSLLKPESPAQFYGTFSSTVYTEATVPSTSQYKVFYHIYAGTDIGASYTVYLKDPASLSYYSIPQQVHIKSGYLARGEQATESIDFTAPTGYKQLCLVVNDQEECGFNSVSTEFTVNVLHDLYAQEQGAENNITSEETCISGSSSLLALANPNIQAGAEESVNPNIAMRGIVRVCASQNPGKATVSSNWVNVGYCGDKSITCWLDKSSLQEAQNVLGKVGSVSDAIEALSGDSRVADLSADEKSTAEQLAKLRTNISKFDLTSSDKTDSAIKSKSDALIQNAISVYDGAHLDWHKAEALYLRASAYYQIVRQILNVKVSRTESSSTSPSVASAPVPTGAELTNNEKSAEELIVERIGNEYIFVNQQGDLYQLKLKSTDTLVEPVTVGKPFYFEDFKCVFNDNPISIKCEFDN